MSQQSQVFKLKARSVDGEPLWAYRYRVAGPRRGEAAGGWVRQQGGGAAGAAAQTGPAGAPRSEA
jgi:hypothetical protein